MEAVISRLMAGREGAVVVLDVSSGKILAAHNLQLAAQRVTAPGSAAKPFVLLELLGSGRIDPAKRIFCRRTLTIAGRRMDCTHSPAVKTPDASDALAYSCNTYFSTVTAKAYGSDIAQAFEHAGFTARTQLADDEAVGAIMIATDTPHRQLQALGEWGVEITPLELLAAYRGLAQQRLRGTTPTNAPVFAGLEGSVEFGMAHNASADGISVAGKSGTAANNGSAATHGFFVGYAPSEKPQIVVMVYLEQGRGSDAAAIAGPIFSAYAKSVHNGGRP